MYQNAGEKGQHHLDPDDPPRRRANQFSGHGTFDNDRPPVFGAIGRDSGEVIVRQAFRSTRRALEPLVMQASQPGATVMSDEWHAYDALPTTGRPHATVNHRRGEFARDDDGDGVREVHNNSMEGFWLGLRNFLRPFRGVSKWWLDNYVHFYACLHNFRWSFTDFLRCLLGPFSPNGP
jgi:transposase